MTEAEKKAVGNLRRLVNENFMDQDQEVSFSYEETKPETQKIAETDVFKQNLHSRVVQRLGGVC